VLRSRLLRTAIVDEQRSTTALADLIRQNLCSQEPNGATLNDWADVHALEIRCEITATDSSADLTPVHTARRNWRKKQPSGSFFFSTSFPSRRSDGRQLLRSLSGLKQELAKWSEDRTESIKLRLGKLAAARKKGSSATASSRNYDIKLTDQWGRVFRYFLVEIDMFFWI
jgi:hypothetical protein